MASKAPKAGDLVRSRNMPALQTGYIIDCEGIHVWVRFFRRAGFGGSDVFARRDSLEVISRANSR